MEFKETLIFTRKITALLGDRAYSELQQTLIDNPKLGPVITGTGGARKLRWATSAGKSGGVRIIYFYAEKFSTCYMIFVYPKSEQSDLTLEQKKIFARFITDFKNELERMPRERR